MAWAEPFKRVSCHRAFRTIPSAKGKRERGSWEKDRDGWDFGSRTTDRHRLTRMKGRWSRAISHLGGVHPCLSVFIRGSKKDLGSRGCGGLAADAGRA